MSDVVECHCIQDRYNRCELYFGSVGEIHMYSSCATSLNTRTHFLVTRHRLLCVTQNSCGAEVHILNALYVSALKKAGKCEIMSYLIFIS